MTAEELTLSSAAAVTHQVEATVAALQAAYDGLPLDEDLPTPRERDENFVRRSLLNQCLSRLQVVFDELSSVEPKIVATQAWLTLLQRAHREFSARLLATPEPGRLRDQLRHALRDLQRGPEHAGYNEVCVQLMFEWFDNHGVVPRRAGNYFEGRGGILSAEARLVVLQAEMASARAAVDAALAASTALLTEKT